MNSNNILVVNTKKLANNCKMIFDYCHSKGISVYAVTKCVQSNERIVDIAIENGADAIADSSIANLKRIKHNIKRVCISLSSGTDYRSVVKNCDISLESEIEIIKKLSEYAIELKKKHRIVLMIDIGDLREGIYYKNRKEIKDVVNQIQELEGIDFVGIGTNITCLNGVLPNKNNINSLLSIKEYIESFLLFPLPTISGGATSTYKYFVDKSYIEGINNLRLGECWMFGSSNDGERKIKGLYDDCFILKSMVVEAKSKNSNTIHNQRRIICSIGKLSIDITNIELIDASIEIVGITSDYIVLNDRNEKYKTGDYISFKLKYRSLARLSLINGIKWLYE